MKKKIIKNLQGVNRGDILNKFDAADFLKFIKKFCGSFIYKGKRSYSIKVFNYLLLKFKQNLKKNPILVFFKIAKNIVPFFLLGQKRYGKRVVYLPILAKFNRKNRYMLNWLVRQLKNRSNIQGVKKEDVLSLLLETYMKRGAAMNLKKEFYNQALASKLNLRRKRFARRAIKRWEKDEKEKKEKEEEHAMLLTFMTEEEIKKWKKKREKYWLKYFFWKPFRKIRRYSYKKFLVK